jgi:hypothetical protein
MLTLPSSRRSACRLLVLAGIAWSPSVSAHISLERGGTHLSRYGDGEIKDAPCGRAGGVRGTNVYTYAPGETITVNLVETIPHPGYFRIAFDDDGDDDFKDPVSIQPLDPGRPCPLNEFDQCGHTDDFRDLYNTPAVLPGMDFLEPHVTASFGAEYTWQVTLPNVQCNNCTLQVIQVMEDIVHGAYNTDRSIEPSYIEDVYHQCIDLVLDGPLVEVPDGVEDGPLVEVPDAGAPPAADPDGVEPPGGDGGCSCATRSPVQGTAAGAVFIGLLLGAMGRRVRARRCGAAREPRRPA